MERNHHFIEGLDCIQARDYRTAAYQMAHSRWSRQYKHRAMRRLLATVGWLTLAILGLVLAWAGLVCILGRLLRW